LVWDNILKLSTELGELKAKIAKANIGIYPSIERMAELKSRISYLQNLPKRDGEEVSFIGRDQEKMVYTWSSFVGQEKCDKLVADLQKEIDAAQDVIDTYNANTSI
jgi:hypothetical protein